MTGSFTLDVYGGRPEWEGNVEVARKAGLAIEEAVIKVEAEAKPVSFVSLTAINENGSQGADLEAVEN